MEAEEGEGNPVVPIRNSSTDTVDAMSIVTSPPPAPIESTVQAVVTKARKDLGFEFETCLEEEVTRKTVKKSPNSSIRKATLFLSPTKNATDMLSDHRTSSKCMVSYGKPATEKNQLNPDVLRRVFSELDTDKDGGLTRLELSLALHRFHLNVPSMYISNFFSMIEHQNRSGSKKVQDKMTISYSEYVLFLTAAYEKNQQIIINKKNTQAQKQ